MPPLHPRLVELLGRVRLVALDVDGVLTDGRVVLSAHGELQSYCVQDGLGIKLLQREGLEVAWISGRGCEAARLRAEELGVREILLRSGPKDAALAALQARLSIGPEETLAMGDDLPDLAMARGSAVFVSVPNGRPEVRARAQIVTERPGGAGAVRELAELLLRARGRWEAALEAHGG
jgi:3-deoxy-D-manno-octulosonate 8-phosphate phosphatase (KDO 8-P phosphatase)